MNWLKGLLSKTFLKGKLSWAVRHGLTVAGGWLVGAGAISPEVAEQATTGIGDHIMLLLQDEQFWGWLMIVLGGGSSVVEKKKR